jgi:phosphoglycolate phosphatase-like HAD superfamily hydrolase
LVSVPAIGTTTTRSHLLLLAAVLLLFDIDGTLLQRAAAEHRDAIHAAISRVYGVSDPAAPRVEAAGRTDFEIARQICLLSGVDAQTIDAGLGDLRIAASEEYAARCPPDLSDRVAPGVPALLAALDERDGVLLALVTGNLEPIARMKLRAAGIGHHFPAGLGGFGSDHEDRTELPAIARARAGGHPRERTIVIGDTPRDIACARADGVRCVAVAGGPYGVGELGDADAVAADAAGLLSVLEPLL